MARERQKIVTKVRIQELAIQIQRERNFNCRWNQRPIIIGNINCSTGKNAYTSIHSRKVNETVPPGCGRFRKKLAVESNLESGGYGDGDNHKKGIDERSLLESKSSVHRLFVMSFTERGREGYLNEAKCSEGCKSSHIDLVGSSL